MKKLLCIPLMLSGIVFANADESCSDKDLYEGAYAGLGLSFQWTNVDAKVSDNFGDLFGGQLSNADNWLIGKARCSKLGGSLALGYGKFIYKSLYLGAEFTLDMTSSKKSYYDDPNDSIYAGSYTKTRGIIPTLTVRLGTYISDIKSLVYLRAGATMLHSKFENEIFKDDSFTNNKIRPVIGLGIERNICRNFNLRLEGDYRFSAKKMKSNISRYDVDDDGDVFVYTAKEHDYQGSIRNKNSGYAVRVVGTYYFK